MKSLTKVNADCFNTGKAGTRSGLFDMKILKNFVAMAVVLTRAPGSIKQVTLALGRPYVFNWLRL